MGYAIPKELRRLTILLLVAIAVLPSAMLCAAAPVQVTPLHIRMIDDAGKPVSGVDVYVFQQRYPDAASEDNAQVVRVGPVKSNATGEAILEIPEPTTKPAWTQTSAFARIPGKMIGVEIIGETSKSQDVLIAPAAPMKGKVTVPPGFNVRDTKLSITTILINDGTASFHMIYPNHAWPELFDLPIADDGSFTVPEAPRTGGVYLAATGKGLGEAQYMSTKNGPAALATVDLKKEGVIEGMLTREDISPASGVVLLAHPDSRSGLSSTHPYRATTDSAGHYRIDGLPGASYAIAQPSASPLPDWVMPIRENVLVNPGETTRDVNLQLERGAVVRGVAINAQTKTGIKDVSVTALNPADAANATMLATTTTDEQGRYAFRLPVGASRLYLSGVPSGFDNPPQRKNMFTVTVAKAETEKAGPNFNIPPTKADAPEGGGIATLRGRVIDDKGKPVPGVGISDSRTERWGGEKMMLQDPRAGATDADGKFQFRAGAGIAHTLRVNDEHWQHDELKPFTPKEGETFTHPDIIVRDRPVIGTITGIVTDPAGKPIEGAEVGFRSELKTDAAGKFTMEIRGERKPVTIDIRRSGFGSHNWNDIPPNAKDVSFILHPSTGAGDLRTRKTPPTPKISANKPAPPLKVAQWIHLPAGEPPTVNAKKTILLFDWNCSEPEATRRTIDELEAAAAKTGAQGILILGPQSHETGVRAMLGNEHPNVAIGIDEYVADSEYEISGATMLLYGFGDMPHAFIIDEKGIVAGNRRGAP